MRLRYERNVMLVAVGVLQCLLAIGCGDSPKGATPALQLTTRGHTIRPVAIPPGTPKIPPRDVAEYGTYGYSAWQRGPGEDEGRKFNLMPAGYKGAANTARLVSFFTMSDIHITDKESPAQAPYFGWIAPYQTHGAAVASLSPAYSPVFLSTTQVLDAAIKTIDALHRQTPLDFGLMLGDACNNSQHNELRWFMDVVDGRPITPSSGAHQGADSIGYQKPYQAAGLDRSIPWYAVVGNHDQYWMGMGYPDAKLQRALVDSTILNVGTDPLAPGNIDRTGVYVGVVDGTTRYGDVVKGGLTDSFATPPTVVADTSRRSLTTSGSTTRNWIGEFFHTASSPVGHGFDRTHTGSTAACYAFGPVANIPLKVIVLDDTCKSISASGGPTYYSGGWIDAARYAWLTNELQKGQDAGQLMIVAAHVPINPQTDLFDTSPAPQFNPGSYRSDAGLIATLHKYPNLILLLAGHRHVNTVTPQPSPDPAHPENGFWEVETPSLRDFPQEFRLFDIRRNTDNSISIVTTDVDPQVEAGSPAAASRGYAIGAARLFGNLSLTDTTSHTYNAELVKLLTPAMQTKIAGSASALAGPMPKAGAGRDRATPAARQQGPIG